jgi:hypothetical protein
MIIAASCVGIPSSSAGQIGRGLVIPFRRWRRNEAMYGAWANIAFVRNLLRAQGLVVSRRTAQATKQRKGRCNRRL